MKKQKGPMQRTEQAVDTAALESWKPVTDLGRAVKAKEIKDIDEILDSGRKILESEVVDSLVPGLQVEFIEFGQSHGKFGGGKRSMWRQTQKKTKEGNKPKFSAMAAVGNKDGYVGIGIGKSKETMPARQKSVRNAKKGLIKIKRGCGSWECGCAEPHTIPYKIVGSCGSLVVTLMPAPKGTGLVANKHMKTVLALAGIKDVYSKSRGKTATTINMMAALFKALKNLSEVKVKEDYVKLGGVCDGRAKKEE